MYRLYGYVPNLKLLIVSFNEEKIIKEIEKHIYRIDHIQFMIIFNNGNGDIAYKIILNENDFEDYKNEIIKRKELKL